MHPRACVPNQEKPLQRKAHVLQLEISPHFPLEKSQEQQWKTQNSQKKKKQCLVPVPGDPDLIGLGAVWVLPFTELFGASQGEEPLFTEATVKKPVGPFSDC